MTAEDPKPSESLSEWLRLQQDFTARLTDETLRYLRRLQGALAPITPGTVLLPENGSNLDARASPGGSFELTVDIHNYQRVHSVAAPSLDPLVSASGTTWYPAADFTPEFSLVPPDESVKFVVRVSVPETLPSATYVGALTFRGFRQSAFRISVNVANAKTAAPSKKKRARGKRRKT